MYFTQINNLLTSAGEHVLQTFESVATQPDFCMEYLHLSLYLIKFERTLIKYFQKYLAPFLMHYVHIELCDKYTYNILHVQRSTTYSKATFYRLYSCKTHYQLFTHSHVIMPYNLEFKIIQAIS